MNKEIAISIRPEHVKNILNGEKTIEIRKRFPKDFKGKVYIYVTKGTPLFLTGGSYDNFSYSDSYEEYVCDKAYYDYNYGYDSITPEDFLNGKVVASFIVDKVEELSYELTCEAMGMNIHTEIFSNNVIWKDIDKTCLTREELDIYLKEKSGYAIYISNLEIFDIPKELSEFGIKRAPQSWMYVKEDNNK